MKDRDKTKQQLKSELDELRQRVAELETLEAEGKQVEEALRKSEEKFKTLVEGLEDVIVRFALDGTILYCSPNVNNFGGYDSEEEIGHHFTKYIADEEVKQELQGFFQGIIERKETITFEFRYMPKNKDPFYVEAKANPIINGKTDEIISIQCIVRDITERKQMGEELTKYREHLEETVEEQTGELKKAVQQLQSEITERKRAEGELRLSSTKWQSTFDAISDAICVLDTEGRIQQCNDAMSQLGSKPLSDMIGHICCEFIHGVPKHLEGCPWISMQNSKSRERAELSVGDKWFEIIVDPILDSDHMLVGAVHVVSDITERKQAEETLRESEEKYRELADSIADVFFAMDGDLRYTYWNKASEKFTEILAEDALGKHLNDLFPKVEATRIAEEVFLNVLRTKQPQTFVTQYQMRGKEFFFENNTYPSRSGLAVFMKDVTERKRAEEEITKLAKFPSENPNPVLRVAQDGNILYGNDASLFLLDHWRCRVGQQFPKHLQEAVTDALLTGLSKTSEVKVGQRIFTLIFAPVVNSDYVNLYGLDITERKRAEEALRESERIYRSLFDNMLNGYAYCRIIVDENNQPVDFVYLEINDAFEKLTGLRRENVVGRKVTEAIPGTKEANPELFDIYGKVALTGEPTEFDIYFKPLSIWLTISVYSPQKGYFVAVFNNITERKQAEEELRQSEERLRLMFESVTDGITITDLDGNVVDTNEAAVRIHGFDSRQKLIGRSAFELIAERDRERAIANTQRTLEEGAVRNIEYALLREDGSEFPGELGAALLRDMSGNPTAFVAITRDITERKQAEEALRESEERYRNIVEMSPDGIVTLNVYGIVTSCNAAFVNLTGYPENEMLGKHIAELPVVGPADIPVVTELFASLLTADRPETVEWQWTCRDGTQKVGEFRMGLIEEAGVTSGFQIVVRDVTGHRQQEEERRRIERLESVGTLAGGIAHDFNNLLTGIMGNISLVRDYLEPGGRAAERLLEAERASLRARDLTQQLLTFARGGEPIKETVSIGELIRDSANFALGGSKSTCVIDIPENLWQADVDKGQIHEVIHNLVINADEAMPGGGVINISARNKVFREENPLSLPKGNYIEVTIEDHGAGIAEDDLARIFEPYFTTKEKGSGLGLATTYSIIRNHEGHITVDSIPGNRTTFCIYLPATRKSSISLEEEAEDIQASGTGKILIMDDEEAIRRLLQRALSEVGHDITLATDGADAIEQYVRAREEGQPFDLVILDLTVPGGMGGVEAMEKLLEVNPDIKSIVSSGYSTDPIMADYKKYGFSAVIAKPYRVRELRRMIRDIL